MFIQKESTEVIEIKEEIKVVGLSLQKSGLRLRERLKHGQRKIILR